MQRWQVGDATITRVIESEVPTAVTWLLPDATADRIAAIGWLRPHFVADDGKLMASVHALVIEADGRRIVVDTCVGNDKDRLLPFWNHLQLPFLDDLTAAGFPRERIDTVVCTHLHVDHVGWNTMRVDGRWVPTFPNARYLVVAEEWAHWRAQTDTAAMGSDILGDSVQPIFDAGLADLVRADHRVCPSVRLEPTPGHTPGHVSVRIRSRDAEAVITGDLIHHPVQMGVPAWRSTFDTDADQARRTRRAFLADCAARRTLVIGTHFATPTAGHVVSDGDVFRFEVA
jgi:glyoxylase-like metal-dependent hydrolase (beta-lactamase superfamily II)